MASAWWRVRCICTKVPETPSHSTSIPMSTVYRRADTSPAVSTSEHVIGSSSGGRGGPSSSTRALFTGPFAGSSSSSSPIASCPFSFPFLVFVFPFSILLTEHPHDCRFAKQDLILWWWHRGSLGVAVHPSAVVVPSLSHPSQAQLGGSGPSTSMYASRVLEPSPLSSLLRAAAFIALDRPLCLAFFAFVGAGDAGRRGAGRVGFGVGVRFGFRDWFGFSL